MAHYHPNLKGDLVSTEPNSCTAKRPLSLEDSAYVLKAKSQWGCLPLSMTVIEYSGDGDPAFGGSADDRALGHNGLILERMQRLNQEPVTFKTIEAAHEAAKLITNRRENSILGVAPVWR